MFRTMCRVTWLSLTRVISRERAKRANACRPCMAASSSSSLILDPLFAAPETPLTGTVPFHTAPQPRMLASVNSAAVGALQTSRPTCGLVLRLFHHCRSRMPAWLIRGCQELGARLVEAPKDFFWRLRRRQRPVNACRLRRKISGQVGSLRSPARPPNFEISAGRPASERASNSSLKRRRASTTA
jgi:hypothetical protein